MAEGCADSTWEITNDRRFIDPADNHKIDTATRKD